MSDDPKPGFRERHRAARRREFLDIAKRIINEEGDQALQMTRLTEEVGASAGGIYVYFSSRDALIAELQQEAFELLLVSYRHGRVALDDYLTSMNTPADVTAMAGLLANCAFWIDSEITLPAEIELSRRLISRAGEVHLDAESLLPTALGLLTEGQLRLDSAAAAGVIVEGDNIARSVMLVAAATGVLLVSKLGDWDAALFDGHRLATVLTSDVLLGWGANRDLLNQAMAQLDAFRTTGSVAPAVTATEP